MWFFFIVVWSANKHSAYSMYLDLARSSQPLIFIYNLAFQSFFVLVYTCLRWFITLKFCRPKFCTIFVEEIWMSIQWKIPIPFWWISWGFLVKVPYGYYYILVSCKFFPTSSHMLGFSTLRILHLSYKQKVRSSLEWIFKKFYIHL